MDYPDSRTNVCICDTPFPTSTALANHQRSCSTVQEIQQSATSSLGRLRERQKQKEERKAMKMAGLADKTSDKGPTGIMERLKRRILGHGGKNAGRKKTGEATSATAATPGSSNGKA